VTTFFGAVARDIVFFVLGPHDISLIISSFPPFISLPSGTTFFGAVAEDILFLAFQRHFFIIFLISHLSFEPAKPTLLGIATKDQFTRP